MLQRAASIICESMDEEHEDLLVACATAKEMWDLLFALHDEISQVNKMDLMEKYHACQTDSVSL